MANNRRKDPTPSETTEGKANAQTRAQEAARKAAEIYSRQRSLMNALLCCLI